MSSSPLVFDGHNDTLLDLLHGRSGERSFFEASECGHLDLPRARDGGFGGGFFAMFVPSEDGLDLVETDEGYEVPHPPAVRHECAHEMTQRLFDLLTTLVEESEGQLRLVRTAAELADCFDGDTLVALAHLEGAEAVAPDLSNLTDLYDAGIRSIGLVWSRQNAFGYGVPFRYPASPDIGPGLTDAGEELVAACNDLGIVVDCAHLNERGFWDVAETSDDPLVVTHTAAHELCPSSRNLTDEQLDAVADSGGVVGITFGVSDLRPDGEFDADVPLSTLVDHVAYVADRLGVDHVALGSDFDGTTVPDSLGDVSGLPAVFDELRARGFDADGVEKVAHDNWLRVLDETLAV
ncbi:membrane dipeptidase [Halogranum gelatinilyticum]|uniref:Membrane dipeptidase n=1 Tax=Halogranum gelatinilyticum TaxID=660521 RepID=A0A1G9Q6J3_9EURY|nr:dipeptidase [Halogranum gelatinilyticum]SDM06672.1 membrane dipeptidase [Halogranum gelatinilyticum]